MTDFVDLYDETSTRKQRNRDVSEIGWNLGYVLVHSRTRLYRTRDTTNPHFIGQFFICYHWIMKRSEIG